MGARGASRQPAQPSAARQPAPTAHSPNARKGRGWAGTQLGAVCSEGPRGQASSRQASRCGEAGRPGTSRAARVFPSSNALNSEPGTSRKNVSTSLSGGLRPASVLDQIPPPAGSPPLRLLCAQWALSLAGRLPHRSAGRQARVRKAWACAGCLRSCWGSPPHSRSARAPHESLRFSRREQAPRPPRASGRSENPSRGQPARGRHRRARDSSRSRAVRARGDLGPPSQAQTPAARLGAPAPAGRGERPRGHSPTGGAYDSRQPPT